MIPHSLKVELNCLANVVLDWRHSLTGRDAAVDLSDIRADVRSSILVHEGVLATRSPTASRCGSRTHDGVDVEATSTCLASNRSSRHERCQRIHDRGPGPDEAAKSSCIGGSVWRGHNLWWIPESRRRCEVRMRSSITPIVVLLAETTINARFYGAFIISSIASTTAGQVGEAASATEK